MFQPNSVIAGRYQVIRLVGQGGMSNLYLCYDRKYNNAVVVVKEMTAAYSDPKEQQMAVDLFHREAKLLASLNHRHIPKVYDYFQFAGKYYLSMEFIDGEDLAQRLEATKGPLPEQQVLEWGEQMSTVLFYLHKHDPPIVFRDVKPSNIMLTDQGVKLIDFGIARHFDKNKKGDTMRIGSPGYAPPEQYAQQTDPRSDIYALGVTLHHALTGRDPTATQTPFLVPPARNLNPALSEATAAMLARATQISPEDRYQNILEMKNDIKHILSRGKQSTRVVGAPPPPPGPAVVASPPSPAAVALAGAAQPAAATPAGSATPSATPAATSPAATSGATGPSVPPSPTAVAPSTSGKKPKKPRRGKSLLLVAGVLLLGGGGLFLAGPELRQQAGRKFEEVLTSFTQSAPDDQGEAMGQAIDRWLREGNPDGLLQLLGSSRISQLPPQRQPLYRLNLLAAEVSETPSVVHLLYPEGLAGGAAEEGIFTAAARAVAAVNSGGGLNKQLLIVLPRSYAPDRLNRVVSELATEPLPKGGQRLLIVDAGGEAAKLDQESLAQKPFVLGEAVSGESGLPPLPAGKEAAALFPGGENAGRWLWAAEGEAPKGAEKVEFAGNSDSLKRLLGRSAQEQAVVVLEASRLDGIEGAGSEGRLLLLAVGESSLPTLAPGAKAEALVLGSPLRASAPGVSAANLCPSPSSALLPAQARLFDALVLAARDGKGGYTGLTLTRSSEGKDRAGVAVRFRWTASGWAPMLDESARKP